MRKLLFVTALTLAAGAAQADSTGLYVGAGITKAKVDNIFGSVDINNTAWKAIAGFRPISLFAVEANYLSLGSQTRSFSGLGGAHADAKAFAAYAVGFLPLPLPLIDVYGKAGLARWQLSGNTTNPGLFAISDHGTEFAWGAGAQVHVGNIAGRLEYERFNMNNTDGVKVYTLGVTLNLL
jgi:hypothetical protein